MSYWVGQKRMREEEISIQTQPDFDSVSMGFSFRGFDDHFSHSQGQSSSLVTTSGLFIIIIFCIKVLEVVF